MEDQGQKGSGEYGREGERGDVHKGRTNGGKRCVAS